MIVSGFLGAASGLFTWVMSLFSGISLPNWANQLQDQLPTIAGYIAGMGVWANFPLGIAVAGTVISVYLACLLVKIILRVVAFLPMVGGAG